MLELQHISYDVEQDGDNKGILHDISPVSYTRLLAALVVRFLFPLMGVPL